jgi:uncharacterized phage-associated protein
MHDVRKIANALLDLADERGLAISNMALNKLAFFAHGWHLALYGAPLTDSHFEAWQFGPVHPVVYRQFRDNVDAPIRNRATRVNLENGRDVIVSYEFDEATLEHLRTIIDFYGGMTAGRLSTISHEEGAPWDVVWKSSGSCPGMTIGNDFTREYYRSKLKRPS